MEATHLKSRRAVGSLGADACRPLRPRSDPRPGPSPNPRPLGGPLPRRVARPPFRLPPAVPLQGLRPTDRPPAPARYRDLPQGASGSPLPLGFPGTGRALDAGRRQRREGLAAGGGSGPGPHPPGPRPLCRRGSGHGFGEPGLCAGLDPHRPVADALSRGGLPPAPGRHQAPHPTRPARSHPDLHRHRSGPPARRALARSAWLRSRRLPGVGPGLRGFCPAQPGRHRGRGCAGVRVRWKRPRRRCRGFRGTCARCS